MPIGIGVNQQQQQQQHQQQQPKKKDEDRAGGAHCGLGVSRGILRLSHPLLFFIMHLLGNPLPPLHYHIFLRPEQHLSSSAVVAASVASGNGYDVGEWLTS